MGAAGHSKALCRGGWPRPGTCRGGQLRPIRKGLAPTEASPAGIGNARRGSACPQGRRLQALHLQELSLEGSSAYHRGSRSWAGRPPAACSTAVA
ncbi:hypothetical protein BHE74_00017179 [Ensete ventricosum]|nr:hypothetical protein GW17_00041122 [Ensete ventricosum]RWW74854.1 hypothetical protein BHE74_00017179 [Ensete ventricosum]RZR96614.1 hypothetical protein BHM03_00025657 [Ensete ventricosum]